jgi:uncharacterized repeat protein (TIGR01451 family)
MFKRTLMWLPVLLLLAAPLAAPLAAQTPTPEGTVIKNAARVTFTDANGNTYGTVTSDTVSVTVGHKAGLTVSDPSSPTTLPNATGSLTYTVTNTGNGTDAIVIGATPSAGLTITGYRIGAVTYETLTLLNTALAADSLAAGGAVDIIVDYQVNAGQGGIDQTLGFTATSLRNGTATQTRSTTIEVPGAGVTVSASPTSRTVVPTNGVSTYYSVEFKVTNTGGASYSFNLSQGATGALAVMSDGGMPATVTLAAGDSAKYTLTYSVNADDPSGTVTLTATNTTDGTVTATATHTATVSRPALTITKAVTNTDGSALSGPVLPGTDVRYVITVTNTGGSQAVDAVVTDELPAELEYVSHVATGWTSSDVSGQTVTATAASLAASASLTLEIIAKVR